MAFSCEDYRFVPKVTDMFKQPLLFTHYDFILFAL